MTNLLSSRNDKKYHKSTINVHITTFMFFNGDFLLFLVIDSPWSPFTFIACKRAARTSCLTFDFVFYEEKKNHTGLVQVNDKCVFLQKSKNSWYSVTTLTLNKYTLAECEAGCLSVRSSYIPYAAFGKSQLGFPPSHPHIRTSLYCYTSKRKLHDLHSGLSL